MQKNMEKLMQNLKNTTNKINYLLISSTGVSISSSGSGVCSVTISSSSWNHRFIYNCVNNTFKNELLKLVCHDLQPTIIDIYYDNWIYF